jgi:hypothetical protein
MGRTPPHPAPELARGPDEHEDPKRGVRRAKEDARPMMAPTHAEERHVERMGDQASGCQFAASTVVSAQPSTETGPDATPGSA